MQLFFLFVWAWEVVFPLFYWSTFSTSSLQDSRIKLKTDKPQSLSSLEGISTVMDFWCFLPRLRPSPTSMSEQHHQLCTHPKSKAYEFILSSSFLTEMILLDIFFKQISVLMWALAGGWQWFMMLTLVRPVISLLVSFYKYFQRRLIMTKQRRENSFSVMWSISSSGRTVPVSSNRAGLYSCWRLVGREALTLHHPDCESSEQQGLMLIVIDNTNVSYQSACILSGRERSWLF